MENLQIPNSLPEFVNRKNELDEAKRQLLKRQVRVLVVNGIGGIGKTSFASKLASMLSKEKYFHAIIWTTAKGKEAEVVDTFIDIEELVENKKVRRGRLRVTSKESLYKENGIFVESMHQLYQLILENSGYEDEYSSEQLDNIWDDEEILERETIHWMETKAILLIIDDLDGWNENEFYSLLRFLPKVNAPSSVIITSRIAYDTILDAKTSITLHALDQDSADKLIDKLNNSLILSLSPDEKREVFLRSGGHPLLIKLILGLISLRIRPIFGRKKTVKDVLNDVVKGVIENKSMGRFLHENIFSHIPDESLLVLQAIAILKDRKIQINFNNIKELCNLTNDEVDNGLGDLIRISLVTVDENNSTFDIHPMTQSYALKVDPDKTKELKQIARYLAKN